MSQLQGPSQTRLFVPAAPQIQDVPPHHPHLLHPRGTSMVPLSEASQTPHLKPQLGLYHVLL